MTAFAAARQVGDVFYLAGQIAPQADRGPTSTVISQTEAAFGQVATVLAARGLTLRDVQYVTGYLSDPADFDDYHRM
jgi:enamine deaminase RidA (YjgF/YER057c/UK114 family)